MKITPGKHLSFPYKGKTMRGVILNEEGDKVVVKLDSGYNISVKAVEMKEIEEVKIEAKKKAEPKEQQRNENGPRITILHTGGTIASKIDYETGAVVAKFTAEEILGLFPELNKVGRIDSKLIKNMQSDDMRFHHHNIIAEAVEEAIGKGSEGIIVTHGTDTLHYTAAALGFILENLPVPVVLVGSQRSSDRGSSDAATNLIAAAKFIAAAKGDGGVFTCMHGTINDELFLIIDGFHSRKMHTSRRDAFKPINAAPYAIVTPEGVQFTQERKRAEGTLKLHPFKPKIQVGILYIRPNMYAKEIEMHKDDNALLILGTGLGHMPITEVDEHCKEHGRILTAITDLAKKIPIAMAPQAINGRINMDVYSPGRKLQEAGILGQGTDMTPETAYIKLAWLLSNYEKKDVRQLYGKNLRGELSKRSENEEFE